MVHLSTLNDLRQNITSVKSDLCSLSKIFSESTQSLVKQILREVLQNWKPKKTDKRPSIPKFNAFEIHKSIQSIKTSVLDLNRQMHEDYSNTILQEILPECIRSSTRGIDILTKKLRTEITLRRKLHNQLIDLKGSIRVFVRVRPLLSKETEKGIKSCVSSVDDSGDIELEKDDGSLRGYKLDRVFGQFTNNNELFGEISQLLVSSMDGYNVSVIAYGITNSGKTYTMQSIYERIGMELISQKQGREKSGGWSYKISLSVYEIYMESIVDLLDLKNLNVGIKTNPINGMFHIPGLKRVNVETPETFMQQVKVSGQNRSVSCTN